uniref:Putative secreted protein n=1 Tax=Amblyomma triste TaxID=251400 RepID=A0A023G114_AMBTT
MKLMKKKMKKFLHWDRWAHLPFVNSVGLYMSSRALFFLVLPFGLNAALHFRHCYNPFLPSLPHLPSLSPLCSEVQLGS